MKNLSNIEYVKGLQSNLRGTLGTIPGIEVMKFLESLCGWYDFKETDPVSIQIAHGKRQVLATIKTLLELKPEEIVALAQEKDN